MIKKKIIICEKGGRADMTRTQGTQIFTQDCDNNSIFELSLCLKKLLKINKIFFQQTQKDSVPQN